MTKEELEIQLPLVLDQIGGSSMVSRRVAVAFVQDMFDHLPKSYTFDPPTNVVDFADFKANRRWIEVQDDDT